MFQKIVSISVAGEIISKRHKLRAKSYGALEITILPVH